MLAGGGIQAEQSQHALAADGGGAAYGVSHTVKLRFRQCVLYGNLRNFRKQEQPLDGECRIETPPSGVRPLRLFLGRRRSRQ